jgi:hypothetical protein
LVVGFVTVVASAHRPRIFSVIAPLGVAPATQSVKLRLDFEFHVGMRLVTVEAETVAGVIDEIVMAGNTVHLCVIVMGEVQLEEGAFGRRSAAPEKGAEDDESVLAPQENCFRRTNTHRPAVRSPTMC